MKKIYGCVLFFIAFCGLFGQTSFSAVFTKSRQLYVLKTAYFDFIFSEESRKTVQLLADKADSMYAEIATKLNTQPKVRFPVVVSPDTDKLNGYYMPVPYNRIVIFDTTAQEGNLDVNREALFSVFLHELTHAISANIKSPFWQVMSAIIGDTIVPSLGIHLPTSFIEGVTVSFESLEKQSGRLNDVYTMQLLTRAKHEKKFPSWQDVAGARDIHPGNAEPYIFGGAFAAFIQQKYGMEKYAEFWHECGKPQFFKLAAGIYKKVYKISLADEWKKFYESIPTEESDPTIENQIFTISQGLIKAPAVFGNTVVWLDTQKNAVFLAEITEQPFKVKKTKRLFSADSMLERLSFSSEGRFLAVSSSKATRGNFHFQNEVRIFDIEKKQFLPIVIPHLRDAALFSDEKNLHVLGTSISGQIQFLKSFTYTLQGKKLTEDFSKEFSLFTAIYSPLILNQNYYAFIQKDYAERFIVIKSKNAEYEKKICITEDLNITPRFLMQNYAQKQAEATHSFYFSWNSTEQTRAGKIEFCEETKQIELELQFEKITGGIERLLPLAFGDFVCISRSYFSDTLIILPETALHFSKTDFSFVPQSLLVSSTLPEKEIYTEKKYNPLKYMYRGLFLPGIAINTMSLTEEITEAVNFGVSFFTIDPSESWQVLLYSGYDIANNAFATGFNFLNTAHTVHWGISFDALTGLNGQNVFTVKQELSHAYYFRNYFTALIFQNSVQYKTNTTEHQFYDLASFYFTNYRSVRKEYHAVAGIQTGIHLEGAYAFQNWANTFFYGYDYNCIYFFNFALPTLLFFENPQNLTLNLPVKNQLQLGLKNVLFKSTIIVFSTEIQKSIPFFPLYLNRFTVNTSYTGVYEWENSLYNDIVTVSAYLTFSPIIGIVTGRQFDTGASMHYSVKENYMQFSFYGAFRM